MLRFVCPRERLLVLVVFGCSLVCPACGPTPQPGAPPAGPPPREPVTQQSPASPGLAPGAPPKRSESAGQAFVRSVSVTPDGRLVAAIGEDADGQFALRLWDAASGSLVGTLTRGAERLDAATFVDDRMLALVAADEEANRQLDFRSVDGEHAGGFGWGLQFGHSPHATAMARSEQQVAAVFYDGTLRVWPTDEARELERAWETQADATCALAVAFSRDGKRLATGGCDGQVKLWEVETGELALALDGHDCVVESLAFSRDGETLYSGCDGLDGRNDALGKPTGSTGQDGRGLVVPHPDAQVLIAWELASHTARLPTTQERVDSVEHLCVTPAGRLVAAVFRNGRGGGSVEVLDVETLAVREVYLDDRTGSFTSLACGSDESIVVTDLESLTRVELESRAVSWVVEF